VYNYLAQDNHK